MEVDYLSQTLDKTLSSYLTQIIFAENTISQRAIETFSIPWLA